MSQDSPSPTTIATAYSSCGPMGGTLPPICRRYPDGRIELVLFQAGEHVATMPLVKSQAIHLATELLIAARGAP